MIAPVDETHDPKRESWLESANGHPHFPIQNLPFGIFSRAGDRPRGGVAIGDKILDLAALAESGLLEGKALAATRAASGETLNPLFAMAPSERRALRRRLSSLLMRDADEQARVEPMLVAAVDAALHLPARIGDYTDFYAGIAHARTVGAMLRPDNPLMPNYKYIPIGYHGRASSIRPSGVAVRRPSGQLRPPGAEAPHFEPAGRLDYELELGVWIGEGNPLGSPIPIDEAERHIVGLSLLNDWSARDIQTWEYQPLGPFLAKNFASTVSPWVVTAEALAPFRVAPRPRPEGDPVLLPYLDGEEDRRLGGYAVELAVALSSARMRADGHDPMLLCRTSAQALYWTLAQLVTHHASGGCNLRPGDLIGTGTISDEGGSSYGSLLELTRGGTAPLVLPTGEERRFLADGDEVALTGRAQAPGCVTIGFGECRAVVLPAL